MRLLKTNRFFTRSRATINNFPTDNFNKTNIIGRKEKAVAINLTRHRTQSKTLSLGKGGNDDGNLNSVA